MCGIAGFVGLGDKVDLGRMTTALAHRGPDGEGLYHDPETGVRLGHRRLAIIDIDGGAQPMWNAERTRAVVYNGEIYNHAELRRELEARGHVFRTSHSDTEVLVHGYAEWGKDLPRRLNGMFAFAIYDKARRQLFLARDRFGEKPLYYYFDGRNFGFASELSALTEHRHFARAVDIRALQKYFAYSFLPAPNALYRNCRKLPGGHVLTLDLDARRLDVDRYWQFLIEPDADVAAADEDALAEELLELLQRAVERRLISDVPLGIFLSGGIDSSATLALAARSRAPADLKTFTIGFTEKSFSEDQYADAVAKAVGSEHRVEILDLDGARALIPEVLARLDEPLGDGSIIPTYMLSRFTRQEVTVALSGDGGDEMFAGYDPFRALGPAALYQRLVPRFLHASLRRIADWLPISTRNMSLDFRIRRTLMGLSYPRAVWNPIWLSSLEPQDIREALAEPLDTEDLYAEALDVWHRNRTGNLVDRGLEFYTNLYLQDDILTKTDRAAMMVSLESRAVFLDNDLVEFCRRLPHDLKYRNGQGKYLLRKALKGVVPDSVLTRPKKGFGIPMAAWLKQIPADPPLDPVSGVNVDWVAKRWQEHRQGKADHRFLLWSWLGFRLFAHGMGIGGASLAADGAEA